MYRYAIILIATCNVLGFGCGMDSQRDSAEDVPEIIDNLVQAGFPRDDIMTVDGLVYVGRDAVVSLQASREMLEVVPDTNHEQYRTTNLVSRSLATICVNGAAFT